MKKLIELKNIKRTFVLSEDVSTLAIKDMSLDIHKGEFVAIMGPSGSGKSTLLHILGFLDTQTDGDYIFNGQSNLKYSEEQLAGVRNSQVGFVFQAFNLLAKDNVYDNVKLPLVYSKTPQGQWHDKICKAIESVGLSHRIDYPITRLSGGEKQRVAIARALVNEPQIIFADEPTGNLDSVSGAKVMQVLDKLNRKLGHTIILITHETETAKHASRIISIKDGKIVGDKRNTGRNMASNFKK